MTILRSILLAFGVLVSACVANVHAAGFRVTFINPGGDSGFWGHVSKTMQAAAADFDVDLEILNADRRPYYMEKLLQERLSKGDLPDYFILVNELQEGARLMQLLDGQPVETVFLLNTLTQSQYGVLNERGKSSIIGSITPNNEWAGYEMAQSLVSFGKTGGAANGGLRMLALTGDDSTPAALDRQRGMEQAAADSGVDLIGAVPVNWNEETAYERAKTFLNRTKVDAIWGANDAIALGAKRAAIELGMKPGENIAFAGLNWSKAGMEAVKNGQLTMTHGGHFFAGAWVIVMLYDYHNRPAPKSALDNVSFQMSAITRDNVNLFLDRLGDQNWAKIDFLGFSQAMTGLSQYDFSATAILNAAKN
ncbi:MULTISPECIES: ABC transporter substrate-binding protein [unclassified Roseibium]|uniref:ABC transporter substrate-binding protein n=1 Tax=unclassified Roseibium TaxID=2629323 RepID=UPI00273E959E|nr:MULTISPECIES: ABC transporter substrate-binding protein [unclassified Roseibium]